MFVKCPHCGIDAEFISGDAELCPECGAELMPPETAEKSKAFSELDMSELLAKVANADKAIYPQDGDDSLAERSKRLAEELDPESSRRSSRGNRYLEIEYNRNLFFVSGSSALVNRTLYSTCRSDRSCTRSKK